MESKFQLERDAKSGKQNTHNLKHLSAAVKILNVGSKAKRPHNPTLVKPSVDCPLTVRYLEDNQTSTAQHLSTNLRGTVLR